MNFCPYLNKLQLFAGQTSLQYLTGLNFDDRSKLIIEGVEMRWWMITSVHLDNYPEEPTDFWHILTIC